MPRKRNKKQTRAMSQTVNNHFYSDDLPELRFLDKEASGTDTDTNQTIVVFGYAALYNRRSREITSKKGRKFFEEILPGAFEGCDFSDCIARFNHSLFLACEPTLMLGTDERGLWYSYRHDPEDPDHISTLRKIQRQDVRGSSFMFLPPREGDYDTIKDGDVYVIRLKRIRAVGDVGPVVRPAYPSTTSSYRSIDLLDEEPEPDPLPEYPAPDAPDPVLTQRLASLRKTL